VWCRVLWCFVVCCGVFRCVAGRCSVLQCVAVCCSGGLDLGVDAGGSTDRSEVCGVHLCSVLQ